MRPQVIELVILSRRRRIPAFAFLFATALSFIALCIPTFCAQPIQIKFVDGKTGHAVTGGCVGVMMGDPKKQVTVPLDANGIAKLRLTAKESEVDISYDPKLGCGGDSATNPTLKYSSTLTAYTTGDNPSCAFPESERNARYKGVDFSTKDILDHGVASPNICGKVAASPHAGEVILFVRPRNFSEKVRDWLNRESFTF